MNYFWLGTHEPSWLPRSPVRLFLSARRLRRIKKLPRARTEWGLDSGGFTELSMHGRWTVSAKDYARDVQTYANEVGALAWAAPQDWMCEPWIVEKTGLTIAEHQRRTIDSVLELRALGVWKVVPVLQGFALGDYLDHLEAYDRAGLDLRDEVLVGVGSVCRRQGTLEAEELLRRLAAEKLRLHAFGAKVSGLTRYHDAIASSDSLAWSFRARRHGKPLVEGCTHATCANCYAWAHRWRADLLARLR